MTISEFTTKVTLLFSQNECISKKKWGDEYPNAVKDIIQLGNSFNPDEIDLFYDLLSRYTICDYDAYKTLVEKAISAIIKIIPSGINKVYVFPLVKPSDFNKQKSSQFVVYLYKCLMIRYNTNGISFLFDKIDDLLQEPHNGNFCVLLVDDFIGTGKTATACINDYITNKHINKSSIIVSVFYSMERGYSNLINKGFIVNTLYKMNRGLTDFYSGNELTNKYTIIDTIAKRNNIPKELKRGLDKSESLLTLMRTPNNTFPMFWSKNFCSPPFPR